MMSNWSCPDDGRIMLEGGGMEAVWEDDGGVERENSDTTH